jgi:hypothetical protein
VLTLYTTPVIYLFFDHLSQRLSRHRGNSFAVVNRIPAA